MGIEGGNSSNENLAKSQYIIYSYKKTIQALIDALPIYVMQVDSDHHIILANKAVCSHLGSDSRDNLGITQQDIRRFSHDPHPGVLENPGLGPALETLIADLISFLRNAY